MLSQQLAMVSTGHSERATLPSWLAAQGAPKEDRDAVGRWTRKDSDDYVRNYKAVVKRLLNKIVQDVVTGLAFDTLDEQGDTQELLSRPGSTSSKRQVRSAPSRRMHECGCCS